MKNITFETKYKIYYVCSDIMDRYAIGPLFEEYSELRKRRLEIIQEIMDENMTRYEQMIFELHHVDGLVLSQISGILHQNMKTVYQRLYKINDIIKILFPVYMLDRKELRKELKLKFPPEELRILTKLQ